MDNFVEYWLKNLRVSKKSITFAAQKFTNMNTTAPFTPHVVFNKDFIEQQEVVVAEIQSLPNIYRPITIGVMTIGLCHAGSARFVDESGVIHEFHPKDIAISLPHHTIMNPQYSDDYRATLVVISKPFYETLIQREAFLDYIKYQMRPCSALTDEQYEKVKAFIRVIDIVTETDHVNRRRYLLHMFDILFSGLTRYRDEEKQRQLLDHRNDQLFSRFYDLLVSHHSEHHEVAWYADQLHLTPKYFSSTIRQSTGKSAAEWISTMLLNESKKMLKTRHDLTIQEIAYSLGFKEIASFCRFFKREAGMTPKAYRKK